MHVVDLREPQPAAKRVARAEVVDQHGRHGEPDEREPGGAGEDEADGQQREGHEDRRTEAVRDQEVAPGRPDPRGDRAAADVRERDQHGSGNAREGQLSTAVELRDRRVDHCDRHSEGQRRPEAPAVELQGLGDQLADSPRLRR